jgi:hypothetical protein
MAKQAARHVEPSPPSGELRSAVPEPHPLDLVVLVCIGVYLVLAPPEMVYLSYRLGYRSPLWGDVLGSGATGLSTLLLLAYFAATCARPTHRTARIKGAVVIALAILGVVLPTVSDMLARHDIGLRVKNRTVSEAHDGGVLQTEAAVSFLLQGQSPYSADYSTTAMAQSADSDPDLWRSLGFDENPAYHFYPYPPLTFLASVPFAVGAHAAFGWFDERLVYLLAWLVLGVLAYRLPADRSWRWPLVVLLALNPISVRILITGRNDMLCETALIATVYLLTRRCHRLAALLLGVACGFKQFAWVLVPFYLAYALASATPAPGERRWRAVARDCWPLAAAFGVVILPFLVWDPRGLLHGLLGAQGSIYPFRATSLGVTNFLMVGHALQSYRDAYPLWIPQLFLVVPVGLVGVWRVWARPALSTMLAWYAGTLLLLLFFGRHFAHNYLTVVFAMMVLAWALVRDESARTA